MQPISPAFKAAVRAGYRRYVVGNILASGLVVLENVPISDGTVTINRNAAQRRVISVTVATTDAVIPINETDPLTPFGNEISIGAGWIDPATGAPYVIPATGLTELVPMGIFPMTTVDETDSGTMRRSPSPDTTGHG